MEGDIGTPTSDSSAMTPPSVAHTLPGASIAMLKGRTSPPPVKPVDGDRAAPDLESSVMLLLERLAIQALPESSMAMPTGPCNPPPVKPVDGESGAPELESSVTLLPDLLVIHTLPDPSRAMPRAP